MSLDRSFKLVAPLGLALLAGCFTANLANAQNYGGKFTLPFEARWGQAVLPPGDYSFTVDHGVLVSVVNIQGESGQNLRFVRTLGVTDVQIFDRSELILVRSGGNYTVRALRLENPGLTLVFPVSKAERQLIVQAPQLLERIPVMGG